jgi:Ca-activated chloride channel family protein
VPGGLPLQAAGDGAAFTGENVRLDRDLVLRLRPANQDPLRLTAFRNPQGTLPEGLALAPWERPSELPPEKDGFFLLEALPPAAPDRPAATAVLRPAGPGLTLAILFDTSLGHRWAGLETAYGHLTRVLQSLSGADRFALIPFDRAPGAASLRPATPQAIEAELNALRERPLGPGADLRQALAAARQLLGDKGRILLLGPGRAGIRSADLRQAAGGLPVFTAITVGETGTGLAAASAQLLSPSATELEADLFFQRLLGPEPAPAGGAPAAPSPFPFQVTGGEPRLRDIYPVLTQPPQPGNLSGWIGRYGAPAGKLHWQWRSALGRQGLERGLDAGLPEKALDARDLPRRWARARVDDLLRRLDAEGERREWIDEIIALSKRYKFVTPYTAFLAAPRALLRPRRIQPGDPVLRVECDPGTVAATALFPFGLKLDLVRRPASNLWEGRFLVPEGFPDGRHPVRILVTDTSGARASETKHFILASKAPEIHPELPGSCRAGEVLRVTADAGPDVVFLTARVGSAPPVPLRWDPAARRSAGLLRVPEGLQGRQEVFFEAVDAAKNRGFARATLEVRQ